MSELTPDSTTDLGHDLEFVAAIAQFNNADYYACHDTLEEIWHNAWQCDRAFYQGILQIAVGIYHLKSQNWHGATILLGEGTSRLTAYLPDYQSVDVESLLESSLQILRTVQMSGKDGMIDLLKKIDDGEINLPKIQFSHSGE